MGIEIGFIVSAFVAGLIMFLAPCTLPLLPAYLGFISGVSLDDMKDPEKAAKARRKIIFNGVFFILGFSIVFILFGTLAGLFGSAIADFRIWAGRIGGALVIIFGLFMLGVFKIPALQMDKRIKLPSFLKIGRPESSLVIGGAFAFGWTPCVGPILASILLLASTSTTAFQGGFLLAVFSLGLAIPFILVAILYSRATTLISGATKYLNVVSIIGGVFLILLGLLLITDNFGLTIQYGYQYLDFLNYDRLLDFL